MALSEGDKGEILRMLGVVHHSDFRERGITEAEDRNCFERDYARILYSASFRRLQGKMQILGVDNTAFYRNRLTHSLEVSQIAVGILLKIYDILQKGNIPFDDLFVLEAAALAHDIGHPAFGHSGERVLNELGMRHGVRFEGNAHNFRVVRTLEKKLPTSKGLNLTYRTLLAINKYIVREDATDSEGKPVEKFIFADDFDYLEAFRRKHNITDCRTIDVQIIELADDIAYAAHDLEDGLSSRQFNIDELLYRLRLRGVAELDAFGRIIDEARTEARKADTFKTNQEYSQVFRQSLTSRLIKLFLSDLSLAVPDEKTLRKRGTSGAHKELTLGKYAELCGCISNEVFQCITREPHIAIYEARGKKLITDLFNLYSDPELNVKGMLFPPDFRKDLFTKDGAGKKIADRRAFAQAAIDYIAGMMDDYAKAQYLRFFNIPFDTIDFTDTKTPTLSIHTGDINTYTITAARFNF